MMQEIETFFNSGIGEVIKAILLLIIAFIVAAVVKSLVVKLLDKTKLAHLKTAADTTGAQSSKAVELIGKLAQLIVFLCFVPGIFECLGLTQVSTPILNLLNIVWAYLPNILASAIILWLGFYVAKLVREILIPVFNKLEVNRLQKMVGIEVTDTGKLSNTLAYLVYVLILIPVIITALQVLNIRAISEPATAMLSIVFSYIPHILAALVIIVIGWVLARFIGDIVTRLIAASGLDAKIAKLTGSTNPNLSLSNVTGKTVQAVLIIFFVVEACSSLHLGVLTKIGTSIIAYMPYILSALLILAIAFMAASITAGTLRRNGHATGAVIAKYAIYVVAAFMVLNELGIARTLVNSTFILIIGAAAVAFAIAFGVGGREFAKNTLAEFQAKCEKTAAEAEAAKTADKK